MQAASAPAPRRHRPRASSPPQLAAAVAASPATHRSPPRTSAHRRRPRASTPRACGSGCCLPLTTPPAGRLLAPRHTAAALHHPVVTACRHTLPRSTAHHRCSQGQINPSFFFDLFLLDLALLILLLWRDEFVGILTEFCVTVYFLI